MSRIQQRNPCINYDERMPPPRFHFKSRYDKDDEYTITPVYTRTKDTMRCSVPFDKIKWNIELPLYNPLNFTSDKILLKDGKTYKDPNV